LNFLLGLINSNVLRYYWRKTNFDEKTTFPKIKKEAILSIPIKEPHDSSQLNEIVKLVDTMLSLNKEKQQTTLPEKLESLQYRIQYTDAKINQLVYRLYGLTEDEIALVEKG
jgi:hypothetical protein